eukprot:SAG31_NODE_2580_length_5438_cov_8.500843_10_plen_109_part_00
MSTDTILVLLNLEIVAKHIDLPTDDNEFIADAGLRDKMLELCLAMDKNRAQYGEDPLRQSKDNLAVRFHLPGSKMTLIFYPFQIWTEFLINPTILLLLLLLLLLLDPF